MGLAVKLFMAARCGSENVVAHMVRSLERSPAAIRDFVAGRTPGYKKRPININLISLIQGRRLRAVLTFQPFRVIIHGLWLGWGVTPQPSITAAANEDATDAQATATEDVVSLAHQNNRS